MRGTPIGFPSGTIGGALVIGLGCMGQAVVSKTERRLSNADNEPVSAALRLSKSEHPDPQIPSYPVVKRRRITVDLDSAEIEQLLCR